MELLAAGISSFKQLFVLFSQCVADGNSPRHIWRDYYNAGDYFQLLDKEYVYLIYTTFDGFVDIGKLLRHDPKNFNEMVKIIETVKRGEIAMNAAEFIECVGFFDRMDFADYFNGNDEATRKQIKLMQSIRNANGDLLTINPYINLLWQDPLFFRFRPYIGDVWKANLAKPFTSSFAIGDQTIVCESDAHKRFLAFTEGLLENSINPKLATEVFQWDNVIVAGGCIGKLLSANFTSDLARQSDVDIFIYSTDYQIHHKTLMRLIDWFNSPNTYYAVTGSVISVYIMDVARKFQLISGNYTSPYEVISRFDFTSVQWYFDGHNFQTTAAACSSARHRTAKYIKTSGGHNLINRAVKVLHLGYDIATENIRGTSNDISNLLAVPAHIEKIVRCSYGHYFPRRIYDHDAANKMAITHQIENDARATIVTTDPIIAMDNIVVCGDFDSGYVIIGFADFKPDMIVPVNAQVSKPMRSKTGIITLNSDTMCLVRRVGADNNSPRHAMEHHHHAFVMEVSERFKKFCALLDTEIYPVMTHLERNGRLISQGKVIMYIPCSKVENTERPITTMRNGAPISFRNDIVPDDMLRFTFSVFININSRCLNLFVSRIVKM